MSERTTSERPASFTVHRGRSRSCATVPTDGGFALLTWLSVYGSSVIMTFEVNRDGVVFQKDLGADTVKLAARITHFFIPTSLGRLSI